MTSKLLVHTAVLGLVVPLAATAARARINISISPTSATVQNGQTQLFTATESGTSVAVSWTVNGVVGGNSTVGTIVAGLYTAPATVPTPATVTVTASVQSHSASASVTVTDPPPTGSGSGSVLWSADFETGSLTQIYAPAAASATNAGGGQFNAGTGVSQASQDVAHGGAWSLALHITPPPDSGTGVVRWLEPQNNATLHYTAWYYFPQHYAVTNYWNVWEWTSKNSSTGASDPFFIVNVGNRSNGNMYFYLYNWQSKQGFSQSVADITPGQWIKLEAAYTCAANGTGHVTFWQNGTTLFDLANVQTAYTAGNCQWSADSYSDALTPSPATLYVDDISISTNSSVSPPPPPPSPSPLVITTTTLPGGATGSGYSAPLTASGGTPPYVWSVSAGSLPSGLTLNPSGSISGTPSTAGVFGFTLQVKDSAATPQSANLITSINVSAPVPPPSSVLWSAGMETGDLREWYLPCLSASPCGNEGGGEFDSGTGTTQASRDVAHSGSWSAKRIITAPPESGTRLFRWAESHTYNTLYYTSWYYFPQRYQITGSYWNVFQWKSKHPAGVDPFYVVNVGTRSDGTMYLYLFDWQRRISYSQSIKNIVVGQWTQIKAMYTCSATGTGQVTVWQDGTLLFNVANVSTRYSDGDCQWSIDNYSDGLGPSPAYIYQDDATISQQP